VRLAAIGVVMLQGLLLGSDSQTSQILASISSPSDVDFRARTRGGQTTFCIGEGIALELSFTGSAPEKYRLGAASYDRSGRLNEEQFTIQPNAGWADPLYRYFHAYQGFIVGTVLVSLKPLYNIKLALLRW